MCDPACDPFVIKSELNVSLKGYDANEIVEGGEGANKW